MRVLLYIICYIALSKLIYPISPERYDHLRDYKQKYVQKKGPIKEVVYKEGFVIETAKYSYNSNNQLVMSRFFKGNIITGYTKFYYNSNGLYQEETYNNKNTLIERIKYTRNKSNKIIRSTIRDFLLGNTITWKFQYQKNQFLPKNGKQYVNDVLSEYYVINRKWDLLIQDVYSESSEKIITIRNKYNDDQQLLVKSKKKMGKEQYIEYTYKPNRTIKAINFYDVNDKKQKILSKKHVFQY